MATNFDFTTYEELFKDKDIPDALSFPKNVVKINAIEKERRTIGTRLEVRKQILATFS